MASAREIQLPFSSHYRRNQSWTACCSCWECRCDHHLPAFDVSLSSLRLVKTNRQSAFAFSEYFWTCTCSRAERRSLGILVSICCKSRRAWVDESTTRIGESRIASETRLCRPIWGSLWKCSLGAFARCKSSRLLLSDFRILHGNPSTSGLDSATQEPWGWISAYQVLALDCSTGGTHSTPGGFVICRRCILSWSSNANLCAEGFWIICRQYLCAETHWTVLRTQSADFDDVASISHSTSIWAEWASHSASKAQTHPTYFEGPA